MNRRRLALCTVAGVLLVGVPAGAEGEPGSGFGSYALKANAPGLAVEGLYRDVALTVPETTSTLTTGAVGAGLSALAWPGPVIGNGGSTLLVLRPDLPPETALLNSPVRAEARTGGERKAANTSYPGTVMAATAEPDEVTASASFFDPALPIGGAGTVVSQSRVAFDGTAKAVARARSEVTDLELADGAITVGSVVSTAEAVSDGRSSRGTGLTTVTGVEVAGIPVVVDEKGVRVAGSGSALPLQQEALDAALETLGLQAVVTAPRTVTQAGTTSYDAGALVLVYRSQGEEYALTVGRASVDVAATPARPAAPLPDVPDAPVEAPVPAAPAGPVAPATTPDLPAAPVDVPAPAALPEIAAPVEVAPAPPAAPLAAPVEVVPVAFALAHGAPAALLLLGLLLVGGAATGLLRLPTRLLAVSAVACPDERSTR